LLPVMVIVRLSGGLGNQLFQYAAARALALRLGTALKLDLSVYREAEHLTPRTFDLGHFSIEASPSGIREELMMQFWSQPRHYTVARIARRWGCPLGLLTLDDLKQGYDPRLENARGDILLTGYWQSERNFAAAEEGIRREFAFRSAPTGRNAELAERIGTIDSVFIHVRRTDYLTPAWTTVNGHLGLDYYSAAIERMGREVGTPHFFVFSDDPEWTQENLSAAYPMTHVTHNTGPMAAEDLRLMSLCRHAIMPKSTFSWWAVWLGARKGVVIAPEGWSLD